MNKLTVVANDFHVPYHDERLLSLFYRFLKKEKPNKLIINGDFLDCYALSAFDKAPYSGKDFKEELYIGEKILARFREILPDSKIVYLCGNHEFRLKKYLITGAPELYGIEAVGIPALLHFEKYRIKYIDVDDLASSWQDVCIEDQGFYVGHFNMVRQHSGATAKALVEKYGVSIVQAHVHRGGIFYKRLISGKTLVGVENYCMCDLNPSYLKNPNWQQGFCVINDGTLTPVYAQNHEFYWGDLKYSLIV